MDLDRLNWCAYALESSWNILIFKSGGIYYKLPTCQVDGSHDGSNVYSNIMIFKKVGMFQNVICY